MPFQVCDGAPLRCSAGRDTARLLVPDRHGLEAAGARAASIDDHQPGRHIPSFGLCGARRPSRACVPCTPAPWSPGARGVTVAGRPVLDDASTLRCVVGGVITVAPRADDGVGLP